MKVEVDEQLRKFIYNPWADKEDNQILYLGNVGKYNQEKS